MHTVSHGLCPGLLLVAALAGCGGGNPYRTVPVSGKVTFDDGSLIQAESVELLFVPQVKPLDSKTYPRNATAIVNLADGTFSAATTYEFGDGLIVGQHKVAVRAMKDGVPAPGLVPAKYTDPTTTDLTVAIERGVRPLELKIPKR